MQASISSVASKRLALAAFTSMCLAACGGGGSGGDATAAAPSPAGASAPVALGVAAPTSSPPVASGPVATAAPPPAEGTSAPAVAAPPAPAFTVQGTDGPDTLESSGHPAVMIGGRGDDIYIVTDPADVVVEQADGGIDEVRTSVGYTLPANVENMSVSGSQLAGTSNVLVGNALNNRITGAPFTKAEIYGMDGDDILDAGGRYGALLDGGNGNDILINNTGESRGGPGADTFVVSPRRAMTAPDVPLTILDFNPDEGDRIDGSFLAGGDPAALFASENLFFDTANQRLVFTRNPGQAQVTAVEQIILLPGVTAFDPAWIIRR